MFFPKLLVELLTLRNANLGHVLKVNHLSRFHYFDINY